MTDPTPTATVPPWVERLLGTTEPVRRALYPVVLAVVALLVGYGTITASLAPLWIALAAAVCGVSSIEAARSVAYSPATLGAYGAQWQEHADDEFARGVAAGAGQQPLVDVGDDEPGQHAADRVRVESAPIAVTRADRCREVNEGRRCLLTKQHTGPHMMTR